MMIYFCFVETGTSAVPYMEPLPAETLEEARVCARRLLGDHRIPIAAHIFEGDRRLDTLTPLAAFEQTPLARRH